MSSLQQPASSSSSLCQTEESQPPAALQPPGSRRSRFLRAVSLFSPAHHLAVMEVREKHGIPLLDSSSTLTAEPLDLLVEAARQRAAQGRSRPSQSDGPPGPSVSADGAPPRHAPRTEPPGGFTPRPQAASPRPSVDHSQKVGQRWVANIHLGSSWGQARKILRTILGREAKRVVNRRGRARMQGRVETDETKLSVHGL